MHYHWNRNLFYHEMLLAIQGDTEKENSFYSDLSDKPTGTPESPAFKKAPSDHPMATSDKAPDH